MFYYGPRPMDSYPSPPDMGGLRANFPKLFTYFRGMSREMWVSWGQPWACGQGFGWPRYNGDVFSIQLTARPGYYVAPDVMAAWAAAGGQTVGELPNG